MERRQSLIEEIKLICEDKLSSLGRTNPGRYMMSEPSSFLIAACHHLGFLYSTPHEYIFDYLETATESDLEKIKQTLINYMFDPYLVPLHFQAALESKLQRKAAI